jgi:protein involved in polysaccharide export with SLBB domain
LRTDPQRHAAGNPKRSAREILRRVTALVVSWAIAAGPIALETRAAQRPQNTAQSRNDSNGQQMPTGFEKRAPSHDLVAENLAHVAATAEQIIGVLTRDSGLMVEMKTLYAREAGLQGQILEESDLTDAAITERLRQDLRLRMLATKLLQRYGYLLPRVNPDSDMAEERVLYLKQKAMEMQRTAALGGLPATGACDPRTDLSCLALQAAASGALQNPPGAPAPQAKPGQPALPDYTGPAEIRTTGNAQQSSVETLLASAKAGDAGDGGGTSALNGPNPSARATLASVLGSPLPPQASQSDALAALGLASAIPSGKAAGASGSDAARAGNGVDVEQLVNAYRNPSGGPELEPVRMVHQTNPYSSVPALYDLYVQAAANNRPAQRFGLDVFQRGAAKTDLLPMDLPVGPDYVVGPGDGLAIDLWGGVSQRITRTVDREGRIALPEAGPVLVAGRTLGEVSGEVQRILRTQFRDVSADVSLMRLRTVRVYVVGEVAAPGAYDISSLSTPLNALFAAGGVTPRGSLRQLEHYRGNELVEKVDAYDLLLHGVRGNLQRLESGDSLRVPPLGPMITVDGMVRRPATYELRAEKNLEDMLDLAGGILPAAALRHIEVQRLVAHEKRTMFSLDLGENTDTNAVRQQMQHFAVQDGDQIHIFPIAPYNTAAVYVEGHVLRPGRYSYREGMRLTDVIGSYQDLLPEPSGRYAEIIRLKAPDYRPVVESFDLKKALENPETAPVLQPLDTVRIFGRYDFEAAPEILVTGEVRTPGRYGTSGQQHLRDVLFEAGGPTPDAWMDSAQVFRTQADGTTKVFNVNLHSALDGNSLDNLLLEPRDRVLIHRHPELEQPKSVTVQGDVAHPGRYPLAVNMHASDLIRAAGGLLRSANAQSSTLTHYVAEESGDAEIARVSTEDLPLNVEAALSGEENADAQLRAGDVLTIPQRASWKDIGASITVRGEVARAGTYGIRPGERLSSVLERAGGFSATAYPYAALLTRRDVRDLEMKAHQTLVQRLKFAQLAVKSLPENTEDQKNLKLTALAQTESTLDQLQANAPLGRLVIHIRPDMKEWKNTTADPVVQDGDVLVVPKKANYVMVVGQVFNPTSVSYRPGRSAQWYLSQAGGFTALSNRQAAFIIRADGSVVAAKNNSTWWSGNPMHTVLKPGDTIIVPERTPNISVRNWTIAMQMSQIAASAAFAAAYILK